jgi:hypothetical protein
VLNTYFPKNRTIYENVEKYGRDRQVTDDNMAHALSLLDNQGLRHAHLEYVMLIAFPQQ